MTLQQLRRDRQALADMFAGAPLGSLSVVVDGQAEIASGYIASGNFHDLLGVKSILGRTIATSDDETGLRIGRSVFSRTRLMHPAVESGWIHGVRAL